MSGQPNGSSESLALSATYTSSDNEPFTVTSPVSNSSTTLTTEGKTAYLHGLRAAALSVQSQVNKELTARMEQDNAKAQQPNDSKDEENYGEEAQEDE